jgi:hypothetical protein
MDPDQITTAAEALPTDGIVLGKTTSRVVISLAIYGGLSLTRDSVRFAKKIIDSRKKTEEKTEVKVETETTE